MLQQLDQLHEDALAALDSADTEETVRDIEVRFLGKKGAVTALLKGMGGLSAEERPLVGKKANTVRNGIKDAIAASRDRIEAEAIRRLCEDPTFDATLPRPKVEPARSIL